jgi:IS30 family transposase
VAYHQITSEERYTIAALRSERFNFSQIARRLGRHRSTISREVRRNAARHDGGYRAHGAIERTSARRSRSRRNQRFSAAEMAQVEALLRKQWSPEQIAAALGKSGELSISHETIYRHVWDDRAQGGSLYQDFRQAAKKRRKRYRAYDSRGRLAGKRHISERPRIIEQRRQPGHWEIDTVMGNGARHCVLTLVERATGFVVIGKLKTRGSHETARKAIQLIRRYPGKFKTITSDNGTEFHAYKRVEKATGVKFYFATPHHAWERGTNENTNGLIRQYLPKRTSMAHVTQHDCYAIAKKLNTRPRKRYDYDTPEKRFHAV